MGDFHPTQMNSTGEIWRPALSPLAVVHTRRRGRTLTVTRDVAAGELLLTEAPYAAMLPLPLPLPLPPPSRARFKRGGGSEDPFGPPPASTAGDIGLGAAAAAAPALSAPSRGRCHACFDASDGVKRKLCPGW